MGDKDKTPGPLVFTGFVDGSYNYLEQSNLFTSGVFDRVYDLNENGFTLQQLAGTFSYLPAEGFGVLVNGMIGRDAIGTNAYGLGTWTGSPDFGVDLTQFYAQYTHSTLTVDVGRFVALNGYEVIAPINDTNFSRSILFGYAGPFTVAGIRASWQATDKLKLMLGANDGWDTITDFTRGATIELSGSYAFTPKFSLALTGYSGKQRVVDRTSTGPDGTRSLLDIVSSYNVTDNLTLALNYDYGWQTNALLASGVLGEAIWDGIAGYVNYKFSDAWRTSVRGEIFDDRGGYRTGVNQDWKEITLTFAYIPPTCKDLEIRAEARHDFSNVPSFFNKNLIGSKNYQQSFALEAFYKFA